MRERWLLFLFLVSRKRKKRGGDQVDSRLDCEDSTKCQTPSYITTIKADAQWCEPDPCRGQPSATGCWAAVCKTCALSEPWDFPSNKSAQTRGVLAGIAQEGPGRSATGIIDWTQEWTMQSQFTPSVTVQSNWNKENKTIRQWLACRSPDHSS